MKRGSLGISLLPLALLGLGFLAAHPAAAGVINSCVTYCHSAPPKDGARTPSAVAAPTAAAFPGNHATHSGAAAASCAKCHPGSAGYGYGHMSSAAKPVIKIAANINSSPATGRYLRSGVAVTFFNQTSLPVMGSCSSVNCHFNATTDTWGATPYATADLGTCGKCHGMPPATANHTKHFQALGSTVASCASCHTDHSTESAKFQHATSASPGGRNLTVTFAGAPAGTGSYSAGTHVAYPNYLSATTGYGSCTSIYCHSSAQGTTGTSTGLTYAGVTWGAAALTCGSCHKNMATDATATGSHAAHTQTSGTVYTCDVCHGTGFSATAVVYPAHANRQVNLSFTANAAGTAYGKGAAFVAGSAAYSTCSANNCHGAMNPVWGVNSAKTRCSKCHGFRAAPWNALNGATVTSDAKAGTHFNHISSAGTVKYAKPYGCLECHGNSIALATDNVNATGHFETAGPADVTFGTLSKTGAQSSTYSAGGCANVYCHGAGMSSNVSNPPSSRVATPVWSTPFLTGTAGTVGNGSSTPGTGDCSKCHGYPPMTATHAGKLATDCKGCHSHVNAAGTGFTDATKHINGVVDASGGHVFPFPTHNTTAGASPFGACTGCHTNATANVGKYGTPTVPAGTPPDCQGCHTKSAPVGNPTTGCSSCHGTAGATGNNIGRPSGTAFPDRRGQHSNNHGSYACSNCHPIGTGSATHGWSNRTKGTPTKVQVKLPSGITFTSTATSTTGGGTCSGSCGGQSHNPKTW